MGTKANIPATVTDCSVLVIGVRDCSSSIARQVDLRSINSVHHLCPGHWYMPDFFQLEREGPVQSISLSVQFKTPWSYWCLIGNAVVDIHLFISLEGLDNFFTLLSEFTWLAPSLLSHFNRLGDLEQNSVPDSIMMIELALTAKLYASSWRVCQEGQKDYRSS